MRDNIQTQEGYHLDINMCCLAQRALVHCPQACLWPVLSDHPGQSSSQDNKKSVAGYCPSLGGVSTPLMHNLQFAQHAVAFAGRRQDRKHRQTYRGVSKTMLLLSAVLKLRFLHKLCSQCKQFPQVQETVWCAIGTIGVDPPLACRKRRCGRIYLNN